MSASPQEMFGSTPGAARAAMHDLMAAGTGPLPFNDGDEVMGDAEGGLASQFNGSTNQLVVGSQWEDGPSGASTDTVMVSTCPQRFVVPPGSSSGYLGSALPVPSTFPCFSPLG